MTFEIVEWPIGDSGSNLQYLDIDEFPKAEKCAVLTFKEENKESLNSLRDQVVKRIRYFEDTTLKNSSPIRIGPFAGLSVGTASASCLVLNHLLNSLHDKQKIVYLNNASSGGSIFDFIVKYPIFLALPLGALGGFAGGYAIEKGARKLSYNIKKRKYEKAINRMSCKPSTDFFRPAIDDELVDLRDAIESGKELRNPSATYNRKDHMQHMVNMGILTPKAESVYRRKLNAFNRDFYEGIGLITRN